MRAGERLGRALDNTRAAVVAVGADKRCSATVTYDVMEPLFAITAGTSSLSR